MALLNKDRDNSVIARRFERFQLGQVAADQCSREIKVGGNPDLLSQMERMIPLGRVGTPEEAAGAVYLFCAPESNFISGQHIICGGGFTI